MVHTVNTPENIPPKGITVIDSETEKDLLLVAARRTRVMAGSAGLANALCQTLRNPPPVLTIIGSMRTETRTQAEQLKKRLGVAEIPLNTFKALNQIPQDETLRRAKDVLDLRQDVILTSTPSTETVEKTKQEAKRQNILPEELEIKITSALAETTEILLDYTLSGIIITGGATALAITKKLGIKNIQILDEVQSGVPVIKLDHLTAVTKAGGFGQADTLIQATQYIKRRHR
jgi:uncharacterized protein YgbK (DUF1537 family)